MLSIALASMLSASHAFAAESGAKGKKELNLVIVYKGVHPWYDPCGEGFQAAAAKIGGIKARIAAPTTWSGEAQAKMLEDLIAEGVDGIAVAVYDVGALTPVINEAMKRGIPVITYDAGADRSNQIMFIGTDNPDAGRLQGEAFVKQMNSRGKYLIFVQDLVSQNVKERVEGIRSVTKKHPEMVEVTSEQSTQYDMQTGLQRAEDLLNTYPDLTGVVDTGMDGVSAMFRTLKEKGTAPGKLKVIGWTTLPDVYKGVKEGFITGTMRQNPYAMGYLAAYGLKYYLDGKRPTRKFFNSGIVLATQDTIDVVDAGNKAKLPKMLSEFTALWK
jgi:ribose transport system substrate-binding protein